MGMATESIKRLNKKLMLFLMSALRYRKTAIKQFFIPRGDNEVGKRAIYVVARTKKPPGFR